jgi:hypothetical protein
MSPKIEIPAIRDADLRTILRSFEYTSDLDNASLPCEFCSRPMGWEDIGALLVTGGRVVVYCDLSDCIEEATKLSHQ